MRPPMWLPSSDMMLAAGAERRRDVAGAAANH